MTGRRRLGAAASALALAVVATAVVRRGAGQPAPAVHTITIDASRFEPARLRIRAGDTVFWINRDVIPHTATAAGTFDSEALAEGVSWRRTVSAAGRIDYTCRFHPTMTGRIEAD